MKFRRFTAFILALILCLGLSMPVSAYDASYEAAVTDIINDSVPAGASDWVKALAVHDAIIARAEYDQSLTRYTAYDLLVYGSAVCEGYARAYMDIMTRLGVPCRLVTSNAMNHAWNIVQIDGSWYHVDVTWDDPLFYNNEKLSDISGSVLHEYFLLSDAAMQGRNHYSWNAPAVCTSTRFDAGALWEGQGSAILFPDADSCYLRIADYQAVKLVQRQLDSGTERVIFSNRSYYNWSNSWGLSLDGGKIYISDMHSVYAIDPADGKAEKVHTESLYIVGCSVRDGMLSMTVQDSSGYYHLSQVQLSSPEPPKPRNTMVLVIGQPTMLLNGVETPLDNNPGTVPLILNDRTLVPVRILSESMGYSVDWDAATRTVIIAGGGKTLYLPAGSAYASDSEGKGYTLDCPASIINDRTMIPIRFVSEYFGADVNWDPAARSVTIVF